MDKNLQNLFFKVGIVVLIVLCLGIVSWSYYNWRLAQNIVNPERIISFTEQGKVIAKPDIAKVSFSVITQGIEAAAVQTENNQKMQKVIDFVKKQGVADKDVQTTNYSLNPQYDYTWCRKSSKDYTTCPPKIVSYTLTQAVSIKIRDFTKINTIVGGLTNAGANEISNITFTLDDPENYKNEARIQALNKIKERAQLLSKETSLKLGKIVSVSESGISPSPIYRDLKATVGSAEAPSAAPIETGTQEITVTLTVSYEIK